MRDLSRIPVQKEIVGQTSTRDWMYLCDGKPPTREAIDRDLSGVAYERRWNKLRRELQVGKIYQVRLLAVEIERGTAETIYKATALIEESEG